MGQNEKVEARILLQLVGLKWQVLCLKGATWEGTVTFPYGNKVQDTGVRQRATPGDEGAIQLFIRGLCTCLGQAVCKRDSQASPNLGVIII